MPTQLGTDVQFDPIGADSGPKQLPSNFQFDSPSSSASSPAAHSTTLPGEIPLVPRLSDIVKGVPGFIAEAVQAPARGALSIGERFASGGRYKPLEPITGDEFSALSFGGTPFGGAAGSEARAPAIAARSAARTENEARKLISGEVKTGASYGAPNTVEIMEQLNAARGEGQPLTLADIPNTELRSKIGSVYRQGGAGRQVLRNFFDERDLAQRDRMRGLIGRYLSNDSMMETAENLSALRSNTGRALWNEAFQGGSLAPLRQQYQTAWTKAGQDEAEALKALNQAQQVVTLAAGKKTTAGNVYSTNSANESMREAQLQLKQAQDALSTAQADKAATLNKLQTAQIDEATNAPGGIWSPYLDRLFQQPEIKAGLRQGFSIQRRDAVGENVPFNPREYALDPTGNPISVPNMRTWAVAKKGLDAIINTRLKSEMKFAGDRPSETTVSYMKLRDGLVGELDRLNPSYKEAREHWSGYTASTRALQDGKNAFKEARFSPEELKAHFGRLEDSDKQFFLLGVADELRTRLRRVGDSSDKSKIINEDARERLRAIFPDEGQLNGFMDAVEREAQMKRTGTELTKGSQTTERSVADLGKAIPHGLLSAYHFAHGNPYLSGLYGLRAVRDWWTKRPDLGRNEAISKLVTDPDIADLIAGGRYTQGGDILPQLTMPPRPKGIGSQTVLPVAIGGLQQAPPTGKGQGRSFAPLPGVI